MLCTSNVFDKVPQLFSQCCEYLVFVLDGICAMYQPCCLLRAPGATDRRERVSIRLLFSRVQVQVQS